MSVLPYRIIEVHEENEENRRKGLTSAVARGVLWPEEKSK